MNGIVRNKRRLQGAATENQMLRGLDLTNARGFQSKWKSVVLQECVLDLSDLPQTEWEDCVFDRCTLRAVNFTPSKMTRVRFDSCDLQNASFRGCWIPEGAFTDCRMQYVTFEDAQLGTVAFTRSNLRHANLVVTEAVAVSYDESSLWGARVNLDCTFFRSGFDDKWRRRFAGLLAWAWPEGEPGRETLRNLAGPQMAAIERLMEDGK